MDNSVILLVDDEPKIVILLKDFLVREGYHTLAAGDGKEALRLFEEHKNDISIVILDVMLPIYDGWTVCREIRKISDVPIIMLTARSEDFDEIHGFEIGASDYVKKPVKPSALMARIKAHLRRNAKLSNENKVRAFGELSIDTDSHIVTKSGDIVELSPKEYALLLLLVENQGKVFSREQLLQQVWGYDYFGGLRTVDTHINRLRSKLQEQGNSIATVRGFGYRFE